MTEFPIFGHPFYMKNLILFLFCLSTASAARAQPPADFRAEDQPPAPDYSQSRYWSALPGRKDLADRLPKGENWISDSLKDADVFYIYPTIYLKGNTWCADVNNKALNRRIDRMPVRFQAGVFNAACRVYAPRYRQSILKSFYDSINGPKALDFAYQDVRRAFLYYLEHYNQGRPIVIASHSQGSRHAWRLLKEFFDTSGLRQQLVCAYVVGMGVDAGIYQNLKSCADAEQTGCFVTWASFQSGYDPGRSILYGNTAVNPITWKSDTTETKADASRGGVFLSLHHKWKHAVTAQLHQHYLWVNTRMPFIRSWHVLHIVDYNLFWFDIRQNVALRVSSFLKGSAQNLLKKQ